MKQILLLFIAASAVLSFTGCTLVDDATSEEVTKSLSETLYVSTTQAERGEAEFVIDICEKTDLCGNWGNVESIVVTGMSYKVVDFYSPVSPQPVSIDGDMSYKVALDWVWLADLKINNMAANLDKSINIPLTEQQGADLGNVLKNQRTMGVRMGGLTSAAMTAAIEVTLTLKVKISL